MKKIIRYMQNTALSYSEDKYSAAIYLNARGKEPQQAPQHRVRSHTQKHHMHHAEKQSSYPSAHAHTLPAYSSGASGPFPIPSRVERFQYGSENIWQSVEVYVPQRTPHLGSLPSNDGSGSNSACSSGSDDSDGGYLKPSSNQPPPYTQTPMGTGTHTPTPKYWIVYIHGGYFRDPKVTASSFNPAMSQLINPQNDDHRIRGVQQHIQGYASINYRLSPHERYPQGEEVSDYERRDAKWPEQLDDVLAGLKWLQGRYGFGERYLLVGHSVGATLALLATLKTVGKSDSDAMLSSRADVVAPLAALGVCGIYDFPALHAHFGPDYEYLTRNAGLTEQSWKDASPALYTRKDFDKRWSKGRKRWLLLAHSKDDGLIDLGQGEVMAKVFDEDLGRGEHGGNEAGEVLVDLMQVEGKHNEIVGKGGELARVIALGVGEMMGLDQ